MAVLICLTALLPCLARADVSLDLSVGFGGRFLAGTWTPVAVTVVNNGRAETVCLRLITTAGSEWRRDTRQTVFHREIHLPAFGPARHALTIPLETPVHPLVVQILDREKQIVLAERNINLRPLASESPRVLMASERWDGLPTALVPSGLAAVPIRARDLADNRLAYDGVQAILLDYEILPLLSPHQWTALLQWIEEGGLLVAMHGLQPETLRYARAQELLPVRASGLTGRLDASLLARWCGAGEPPAGNLPLIGLSSDPRWIALEQQGVPIVCFGHRGNGRVVVTAFDLRSPAVSHWHGRHLFWQRLALPQVRKTLSWRPDDRAAADLLLRHLGRRFPAFESVLLLICIYVFLVMAVAFRGAGGTVMVVFITLVLSTAAGIFVYRPAVKASCEASSFSVFDKQAGRRAGNLTQLTTVAVFASGTVRFEQPLRQGRLTPVALPPGAGGPLAWEAAVPMDASFARMSMPAWHWRGLRLDGTRTAGVDAAARKIGQNLQVRTANRSARPLLFPWVVWSDRVFLLEDIPAGGERGDFLARDRGMRLDDPETRAAFMAPYEQMVAGPRALKAAAALVAYDAAAESGAPFNSGTGGVRVYGWLPAALAPLITADGRVHEQGLTLVSIRIPLDEGGGDETAPEPLPGQGGNSGLQEDG